MRNSEFRFTENEGWKLIMRRAGKEFEKEIRDSLKDTKNIYWERFFDFNTINAVLQSLKGLSNKMGKGTKLKNYFLIQPPKQPADYWVVRKGDIYFFECKKTILPNAFPFKNIKLHQFDSAFNMNKNGGNYIFFLNKRNIPLHFRCFAVRGIYLWKLKEVDKKNEITWDELDRLAKEGGNVLELERLPKGRWGIEKIFDYW